MQKLLALLLVASVSAEAPYAPSGWKPDGPAFGLPQDGAEQRPQNFPDPRNPRTNINAEDVSVQGLPVPEPVPQFQVSPVSGQQYTGPSFQQDIRSLDERYRQRQYQLQQQRLRELARQHQQYSAPTPTSTSKPTPVPRQFAQRPTQSPTTTDDQKTTTESLNEGEVLGDQKTETKSNDQKVSVEITKQNIQEYPPELFLGPLAQIRVQTVRNPGQQFAQLIYQPSLQESQKQTSSPTFDGVANLGLVQSILSQNQQQSAALLAPREPISSHFILISSANQDLNQYQPLAQQYQLQPVLLPAQLNQLDQTQNKKEPEVRDVENDDDDEEKKEGPPQFVGQPQFVPQQPRVVPQQFVPQQQQFVPQQQQFVPQQQQFIPQKQESVSRQKSVTQQQQLTAQQQQFTSQQQQQFVPQQQQFVPQQQQFVPQQQQFAPQQQQFVPQQQQFVPSQQQFVPQQQQFVPQQHQFVVEQPQNYEPQEIQYQYQPVQYQPSPAQLNYQQSNEDINMYYQQQQLLLQQQQQQLLVEQQQLFQRQNQPQGLQSDAEDVQRNDVDQPKENDGQNGGQGATAVATAFGDRNTPRVFTQYGAPVPDSQATTENDEEATTTETTAAAEAVAVSRDNRRKSAKLRTRRLRPIFGVDKSGHLVQLMQEQ